MVLSQRSVLLVANLLNGARSGIATGLMFAIAVTVVAKLLSLKFAGSANLQESFHRAHARHR